MSRQRPEGRQERVTPRLLENGDVFGRHGAAVKVEAWNTTSHAVRLTISDSSGQHYSAAHLSHEAATCLERHLKACRLARRDYDDAKAVTR